MIWHDEERDKFEIAEEVINQVPVQVMITGGKNIRIERVLSTDPRHFLDSACQPGQEVQYSSLTQREKRLS